MNVDNEADSEALEKLGAIRMPESMVSEIFGNNAKYADNTTCVITENSSNAEFPFNVQFDNSKIPATPQTERKLTDNYLAGLSLPQTTNYINIPLTFVPVTSTSIEHYSARFIAPANGWIYLTGVVVSGNERAYATTYIVEEMKRIYGVSSSFPATNGYCASFIPAFKKTAYNLRIQCCNNILARFIYAQGEI